MRLLNSVFCLHFVSCLLVILLADAPLQKIHAQGKNPVYSKETETRISLVENHLAGWYQAGKDSLLLWNLRDRMDHYHVRGVSIAVIHHYRIEWARGYGWADIGEQRPVDTSTLFQAASISKSINATGILTLAQDNKADLYTDINRYLKTWSFPYDSVAGGKKITLALLLTHQAGLNVGGFDGYQQGEPLPTINQMLEGKSPANSEPLRHLFAPGTQASYSGGGILLSRKVLEDITGIPYAQYMRERVLQPMGMSNSFFTQPPPGDKYPQLATAYDKQGKEIKGKFHIYPEIAPDGLWTTPSDLGRYIIETQLSYQGRSHKVLSPAFTRLQLTPYLDSGIALGTFVGKKGDYAYFQHGGQNEGFLSRYYGGVESGEGVVIMVNSAGGTTLLDEITSSVALVYGWKNFYQPTTRKVITLPRELLQTYEGEYLVNNRISYSIHLEDGKPFLTINHKDRYLILFTSATDFFFYEVPFTGKMVKNAAGVVDTIEVNRPGGGTLKAIRK